MTCLYHGFTYDLPNPSIDFTRLDAMRQTLKRRTSDAEYQAIKEIALVILMNNDDEKAFVMIQDLFADALRDIDGRDEARMIGDLRKGL